MCTNAYVVQIRIAKATRKRYNPEHTPERRETSTYRSAGSRLERLQREHDKFDAKHADKLVQDECVAAIVIFNCEDSRRCGRAHI